jgi:hypothetical protein
LGCNMFECDIIKECPFYNDRMLNMPAFSNSMKKIFCHVDNSDCARHMIKETLGLMKIPHDLFPNESERAREIIKNHTF